MITTIFIYYLIFGILNYCVLTLMANYTEKDPDLKASIIFVSFLGFIGTAFCFIAFLVGFVQGIFNYKKKSKFLNFLNFLLYKTSFFV